LVSDGNINQVCDKNCKANFYSVVNNHQILGCIRIVSIRYNKVLLHSKLKPDRAGRRRSLAARWFFTQNRTVSAAAANCREFVNGSRRFWNSRHQSGQSRPRRRIPAQHLPAGQSRAARAADFATTNIARKVKFETLTNQSNKYENKINHCNP
jgi:hypothetical protein